MLGQTISHYRITHRLGSGGMGVVYKADDLTLERTVALKFLPQDLAIRPTDKENLLREARSASALDHPNIGVIHGLEESDDHQLFIVMGYYEGETLTQKINRGVVSVRDSLDYAIQIARGLSAAHARNIVHRDIKPSNIIITTGNVAKIVDFGLARTVSTASATQSVSNTGTLPYMAPEQILGEPIDQRVDVWALGVIMVQMLTGSHPFLRPNSSAMTFAILNQPPTAVDAVPVPVQPIVYRALSKQASHRYASTQDMVNDLEAARAQITATPLPLDEPTVTRAVSPRELRSYIDNASTPRWGASPRKVRRILLAAAAIVLVAAGVLFVPTVREQVAGLTYAYSGGEKHIAVLPFTGPTSDAEFAPVIQGLSDSVTGDLSNLDAAQQSLWVVPASSVRHYEVTDAASAFHKLGATVVVEGRLERHGPVVYLTINLIDSKRLRQIGSARLSDRSGDLSAVENQAVHFVAQAMRVKASPDALRASSGVPPSSYESYLKALGYLQRFDKPGNIDLAISAVLSAVQSDPGFALGYATLGDAYRLKYQTDHHPQWLEQAASNCHKALQIDPHLASARVTLARLEVIAGKNDLALEEFRKTLEIDSRNADALYGMGEIYESLGRAADAEATYQRAIALRPDYWGGYNYLAAFYDAQHRPQEAIATFRRVTQITPDNPFAYSNLGAAYMDLGDPASQAEAQAAFEKSLQLAPTYQAYSNLGYLYLNAGRYAEAAENLRKALELNDQDWRVWANLMEAYNWLKDTDKAHAIQEKYVSLLEQSAAAAPGDANAQASLGMLYSESGQRQKALACVKSALAAAPKDGFVLAGVAQVYENLGDRKRAVQFALDSLANGTSLQELQHRLGLQGVLSDPSFHTSSTIRSSGK
jgi:eukaryotic-like serine/threonine-protein kinase